MEEVSHGFLTPPAHTCPARSPGPSAPGSGTIVLRRVRSYQETRGHYRNAIENIAGRASAAREEESHRGVGGGGVGQGDAPLVELRESPREVSQQEQQQL